MTQKRRTFTAVEKAAGDSWKTNHKSQVTRPSIKLPSNSSMRTPYGGIKSARDAGGYAR
jgi:hypothetical protein